MRDERILCDDMNCVEKVVANCKCYSKLLNG
jgi:hypothetical protein